MKCLPHVLLCINTLLWGNFKTNWKRLPCRLCQLPTGRWKLCILISANKLNIINSGFDTKWDKRVADRFFPPRWKHSEAPSPDLIPAFPKKISHFVTSHIKQSGSVSVFGFRLWKVFLSMCVRARMCKVNLHSGRWCPRQDLSYSGLQFQFFFLFLVHFLQMCFSMPPAYG